MVLSDRLTSFVEWVGVRALKRRRRDRSIAWGGAQRNPRNPPTMRLSSERAARTDAKCIFQPGTDADADADVTTISNLARERLQPGTLPTVVLKFDASSLPVCLITLKGEGLNETQVRNLGQFTVRNQVANVPGISVPVPFGGKYRQIMGPYFLRPRSKFWPMKG
jgi:hypothetical protein